MIQGLENQIGKTLRECCKVSAKGWLLYAVAEVVMEGRLRHTQVAQGCDRLEWAV